MWAWTWRWKPPSLIPNWPGLPTSNATRSNFSAIACPTCPISAISPRSTGTPSLRSTFSPPDIRVSHSRPRAAEREKMTTDTSGPTSTRPFASYDRNSRCWKTLPDTEAKASTRYSATLPRSGYLRNGCLYEHPISAHHTDAIDFSSLSPSPTQANSRCGSGPATAGASDYDQTDTSATDTSSERSGGRGQADLDPRSAEPSDPARRRSEDAWGEFLPAVQEWERRTRPAPWLAEPNRNGDPRLSPRCVEWMMGLPEGWVTATELGLPYYGQLHLLGNGVVPQQAAVATGLLLDLVAIVGEHDAATNEHLGG
ncbi:hypothetical protein IU500_12370 [Nocardia terpenica]|nr:hypothetical protein [Nocardia terpenica]MBF6104837.1 hypothetical protein [Nocardia terpenica]MBF6112727.1 hypothetical protein [Nocardia terpenica]MBF6118565.1 hypothetical protein [Nocardia terpenica]MBF6155044.1 hypothetical protein [Nocardia terpenica]